MKKIAIFFLIIIVIVVGISYIYLNYKMTYNQAQQENQQFESYYNKEIYGTDLTTIINKAIDKNIENRLEKDKKGFYIQNNTNSINIDIKIADNDTTYKMETIYQGKMDKFVQYYGQVKFKCTKIDYHNSTKKISYMLFEQVIE